MVEPFRRGMFASYGTLGPLDVSPIEFFFKPDVLGLISVVQIPRVGVLDMRH